MVLEKAFFSGSHIKDEIFDDILFKDIQTEFDNYEKEVVQKKTPDDDFLNRTISYEEVTDAIQQLKIGITRGEYDVYSDLIIEAGETSNT